MSMTWVEIDLGALRENYRAIRALLADGVKMAPVVKADAYGHGLVPVARELDLLGAEYFGVNDLAEARALRDAGIEREIMVLLGVEPQDAGEAVSLGVIPVVYSRESLKGLDEALRSLGAKVRVHLKMDTGMGRLGQPWWEAGEFFRFAASLETVEVTGLCSHFSTSDEADKGFSNLQIKKFKEVVETARHAGLDPEELHMANSAGIIDLGSSQLSLVRPGITLYGCQPSKEMHNACALSQVMRLKTRVAQVKTLHAGSFVGYGNTYVTERETRMAVLPVGYANGLSRLLTNRGEVLVRGRRAPIIGRVSMSLTTVDVTDVRGVIEGDDAVIMGFMGREFIGADDIAELTSTISYEVLCLVGSTNERVYLGGSVRRA